MFSIVNIGRTLLAKIVSFLYVLTTTVGAGLPIGTAEPTKVPDDFEPVIRFAVCSDAHLKGDETEPEAQRLTKLINFMYDYSGKQEYKNFDALVCVGDMCDTGYDFEYDELNKILSENLDTEKTQLLICTGNHEYIATRDYDASLSARLFEEKEGDLDTHVVINGYHFIMASYDDDGNSFDEKVDWIEDQLEIAEADTGDKPIFTFQHPAPFATVYGSINWGDISVPKAYLKYPQSINFSGHSHYPVNDPRSLWQGGFTALGCGSLSYFETELDCIAGNFPYDNDNAAQFYIVEADADGNVHIMPYDLITDQFFAEDYYLTDLADRNYEYSYARMKKRDSAPQWPDDTKITTSVNENGETILTFTGATDKYVVESYKVSVTENGLPFTSDNFSGKYMYLYEDNTYDTNLGVLTPGKTYRVQIVALNAYAETSKPMTYKFVAE